MAYEMNAEGVNGVQQTTVITVNVGGGGWFEPPPPPPAPNPNTLLFIQAGPLGGMTPNLAALQCVGNAMGPGSQPLEGTDKLCKIVRNPKAN